MGALIINANALNIPLANESVQCIVTSPPYYGLRSYGIGVENGEIGLEQTPDEYIANLVEVFRECKRILRDDGTLWVNIGDTYASSPKGNKEPSGLQSVNYGIGKDVPMKKNINWTDAGLKLKDLIGIPWMLAFALRADGWYLRQDIIWAKPNPMPESVKDRCTKSHEYIFLLSKSAKYYYDNEAVKEESTQNGKPHPTGQKVSPDRNDTDIAGKTLGDGITRNKRDVWTISTQPTREAHFATFPEKLVEPCILAGSKVGDIVFDPFMGSGTVARVATKFGRNSIGTELNYGYCKLSQRLLNGVQPVIDFSET